MTSMLPTTIAPVTGPRLTVQFSSDRPALERIACECYANSAAHRRGFLQQ
jgi:hypothetical protein